MPAAGVQGAAQVQPPAIPQQFSGSGIEQYWWLPVPAAVRFIWLGVFAILLSLGIALFVAAGNSMRARDFVPFVSLGCGAAALALISIVRAGT